MNWQSALILFSLVAVLGALVWKSVRDRKQGKRSCACGGNCGACKMCKKREE